jgi:hypothetical protein
MQIRLDGRPLVDGETVTLDHSVQKFEIIVRSLNGIAPQKVKDLIQKSYEVVSAKEIDRRDYVTKIGYGD